MQNSGFERSDIWREGAWLDLWSVVHLLSGTSTGLGFYFLHFGALPSVVIALLSFILYETWEMLVGIKETSTNRFMDVVVDMASFLPAFFILAPALSATQLVLVFGLVFVVNSILGALGWRASQKAAALEKRLRARYALHRARLAERGR